MKQRSEKASKSMLLLVIFLSIGMYAVIQILSNIEIWLPMDLSMMQTVAGYIALTTNFFALLISIFEVPKAQDKKTQSSFRAMEMIAIIVFVCIFVQNFMLNENNGYTNKVIGDIYGGIYIVICVGIFIVCLVKKGKKKIRKPKKERMSDYQISLMMSWACIPAGMEFTLIGSFFPTSVFLVFAWCVVVWQIVACALAIKFWMQNPGEHKKGAISLIVAFLFLLLVVYLALAITGLATWDTSHFG